MKKLINRALAAAVLLMMTTCSEPIDFLAEVETEVKIANDLFLVVEQIDPAKEATQFNPQDPLRIFFDRPINLATVTTQTVSISNGGGQVLFTDPQFDAVTNILTIYPDAPFVKETRYTVVLNGIRGRDGSEMLERYSWAFTTGNSPAGSFAIDSQNPESAPGYSDSLTLDIDISVNDAGNPILYYVSESDNFASTIADGSLNPLQSVTIAPTISAGDGTRTLYFRVAADIDGIPGLEYGSTIALTVIIDTQDPDVSNVKLADNTAYSTSVTVPISYSVSDNRSLSELTVEYSTDYGTVAGTVNGPSMSTSVQFNSANYVSKTATVTVMDKAGNTDTASDSIYIDNIPPNAPSVSGTSPTTDTTPTWSWTSGGNGGVGYYKYKLDSSAWSGETTAVAYTPGSALSYGSHTLYVIERDARGNWSGSGSRTIVIPVPVLPADGAKSVSTRPFFDWPSTLNAVYALQIFDPGHHIWITVASALAASEFDWPRTGDALPTNTTIEWRYGVKPSRQTFYTYSPIFSFTTVK